MLNSRRMKNSEKTLENFITLTRGSNNQITCKLEEIQRTIKYQRGPQVIRTRELFWTKSCFGQ